MCRASFGTLTGAQAQPPSDAAALLRQMLKSQGQSSPWALQQAVTRLPSSSGLDAGARKSIRTQTTHAYTNDEFRESLAQCARDLENNHSSRRHLERILVRDQTCTIPVDLDRARFLRVSQSALVQTHLWSNPGRNASPPGAPAD